MNTDRNKEEIVKDIKSVLESKVAPSVAEHNGFINYMDFDEKLGVLKLEMAGSCSGCAMSKLTLQQGVERTMKHFVPEVTAIISEDDLQATEQGYTPFMPQTTHPE